MSAGVAFLLEFYAWLYELILPSSRDLAAMLLHEISIFPGRSALCNKRARDREVVKTDGASEVASAASGVPVKRS